jgi:hypothetical protein
VQRLHSVLVEGRAIRAHTNQPSLDQNARTRRRRPRDVFNRPGVYTSPETFVSGFHSALWVAVAFSGVGTLLIGFLKARVGNAADTASSVEPHAQPAMSIDPSRTE